MHRDGHKHGYYKLGIRQNGVRREVQVATLMLQAFVGPCPEGCTVDHIDRDTTNNKLENLRWANKSQQHANMGGQCQDARRKNNRPIQYRRVGEIEWKTGPGRNIVADKLGMSRGGVHQVLIGNNKQNKGFEFRWAPTESAEPCEQSEEQVSKRRRKTYV